MHLVWRARPPLAKPLELDLEVGQCRRVEQLAQLLLAEQLAQPFAIQRQGLGPAFRQRRVALVHVLGDVVEEQRAGERRRRGRLHRGDADLALLNAAQHLLQGGQVEDVLQALAVRLEQDGKRPVAAGDGHQVRRALAHLPERRPRIASTTRQQQRPRRIFAEAGRK